MVDHSGLCIFGYIVPPTWNDLSLSFCHFQDSLLHEALPDNPSPSELSLRLPASIRHHVLYVISSSVVEWALGTDEHSPALPLPGCAILSKLLPLSESQFPPYPWEEIVPPHRAVLYKVFCMPGAPSPIFSFHKWQMEAQ